MLAASAVDIQRGFTPGRQLVANGLELDTYGRWYGAAGHEKFELLAPRIGPINTDVHPRLREDHYSGNGICAANVASATDLSSPSGSVYPAAIRPSARVAPKEASNTKKGGAQGSLKEQKGGTQERLKEKKGGTQERLKEQKGGAQESLKKNGEWPREPHYDSEPRRFSISEIPNSDSAHQGSQSSAHPHRACKDILSPKASSNEIETNLGPPTAGTKREDISLETARRCRTALATERCEDAERLLPILCFWDFAAAFPSVAHLFLMLVLSLSRAPQGFINIIEGMYAHNAAFTVCEGVSELAFWILSGVLQGCPLSGMLFALVMDPFLRCMKTTIQDKGLAQVRACADDVGAALKSVHVLKLFEPIFETAAVTANLRLKPKKCVVIPTSTVVDAALRCRIRRWLETNIPSWKAFNIASSGKYLGFHLGPSSADKQWVAPSAKWRLRASAIASTHSPASAASHLYNTRAVPVMGYVAQLALLPTEIATAERGVVSALLHVATNTFDDGSIFNLSTVGGPAITSLKVLTMATLARAALKTLPEWKKCCAILAHVTDDMPISIFASKVASPACWDSSPFAFNLKMAAEHFKPLAAVDKFLKPSHYINKSRQQLAKAGAEVLQKLSRSRIPLGRKAIQKEYAVAFKAALLPSTLERLLASRFVKHFAPVCKLGFIPCWEEVFSCLQRAQTHFAMAALKTLLNSWCTRGRYHDGSFEECVFGCLAPDDITHYVCCPFLWGICALAASSRISDDVEDRILLRAPSTAKLAHLVTAFTVYHAVKLSHAAVVTEAMQSGNFEAVLALARRVADAQWIKMGATTKNDHLDYRLKIHDDVNSLGKLAKGAIAGFPQAEEPRRSGHGPDEVRPLPECLPEVHAESFERRFCEPECNEFPSGAHHPCCSQALLAANMSDL